MSYVLDALAKSEAERTSGLAESAEVNAADRPRGRARRGPLLGYILVLLAAMALGAGAWIVVSPYLGAGKSTSPSTAAEPGETTAPANVSESAPAAPAKRQDATGRAPAPVTRSAAKSSEDLVADVARSASAARPTQTEKAVSSESADESVAATRAGSGTLTTTASPSPTLDSAPAAPETPAMEEGSRNALLKTGRTGGREYRVDAISYAGDSTARFAMIDQTIVREGEQIGNGVSVVEIRRDGVLVELNGQRYYLTP